MIDTYLPDWLFWIGVFLVLLNIASVPIVFIFESIPAVQAGINLLLALIISFQLWESLE